MAVESPWVADSIEELIVGAAERRRVRSIDARSGATFEKLTLGGRQCFLKVLSAGADWIMRVTGNTSHWELTVWRAGLYHAAPAVIDHAMIGMALDTSRAAPRLAMLMHDRTADLVPPGDSALPVQQHRRFVEHMATMHAAFVGWHDDLGLQQMEQRLLFFAPATIAAELRDARVPMALQVADRGWARLPEVDPGLDELVRRVHADPERLAEMVRETPQTFLAGDWKCGNLGSRPTGQTVLLDWAYPGEAPPCWELAWYLALNRARLPESKPDTIARYRRALADAGLVTEPWWQRQLDLCLVAIMATFAWEKAVGPAEELAWWSAAAQRAAERCAL